MLKNYWLRIATVYLALLGLAFLITSALLLPTYFYISYQINALSSIITSEDEITLKQIESEISNANSISKLLLDTPQTVADSEVISEVLAFSQGLVNVGSIDIRKSNRTITEVVVTGTALNRNTLVSFRDSAEGHRFFSEVNLPLANLAKDQDIPFSLTLEPSEILNSPI